MVQVLKNENGTQIVSANLNKTIQTIKEIVMGNHSDSDIYSALKECNMDPNDAAQKLLNQDPFHEVRRRRDKKKENAGYNGHVSNSETSRKRNDNAGQGAKPFVSDRNVRRGGNRRITLNEMGVSREFRVVRDNRVNQISDRETKSATQSASSETVQRTNKFSERRSYVASNNQRYNGRYIPTFNRVNNYRPRVSRENISNIRNENLEKKILDATGPDPQVSLAKPNEFQSRLGSPASSSAVGVYASASDPVHVPSPDSRSPAAIGAIRREVGVVGGRRQSSENGLKQSLQQSGSSFNPVLGTSTTESFHHTNTVSRSEPNHAPAVDSVMIGSTGNRINNHFNSRLHQQPAGQRGALPSKEWKPKTSQKSSVPSPGVIGSPVKTAFPPVDSTTNVEREADELQDKLSQINIRDSRKVIIAQHIRVPETDRCRVTFGSFVVESDSADNLSSTFQAAEIVEEPVAVSSNNQSNAVDEPVQNSAASSPSGASFENELLDKKDSSDVNISRENYSDISLVHNSSSFTTLKPQQFQESSELPTFSTYDPQPAYDIPYFRPSVDDAVRGSGQPSTQEALSSHTINNASNSSVAMMQQQTPMAQMYPQVHLSHYANVMPYRQFIPPMYVPPMVPGYSGNPAYPHLSNGSSYVLMPGGNSHLPANGLKYGVQQFKPFPAASPTGFGSLASPTGYAINAPGVVGGPTGLDDSSRLKYKDNSLYVPNPQAETSEVWIQNHRDLSGMQPTQFYNMQGQTTHPAHMQSHPAHASFNAAAAAAQLSQMQFPGMYPPQPTGMRNAHHLGAGNLGVGVAPQAPGAQVGAYQQPQMNHLNWTTNF